MADVAWNPWRSTAVGAAVAGVTALTTFLVMGTLGPQTDPGAPGVGAPTVVARGPSEPSAADIEACRDYARTFSPERADADVRSGGAKTVRARAADLEAKQIEARYAQAYQACMKGRGFGGA
jgi:hypothetical protein